MNLLTSFQEVFSVFSMFSLFIGVVSGIIIGALPGLSVLLWVWLYCSRYLLIFWECRGF